MDILIAPNAFKGSLHAKDAADAIRRGFLLSRLKCRCKSFPIGDGGDGTAELIVQMQKGSTLSVSSIDALGRSITARLGIIADKRMAVMDLADASGLKRLEPGERDPIKATTFGTGMLLLEALERGTKEIILGVGGSATVDGGTGILRALGVTFLDSRNKELTQISEITRLARIDISGINSRIRECTLTILCDVENYLLGTHGAARVFGPQKGADIPMVKMLEQALQRLCFVVNEQFGIDMNELRYGGAAGGVAAGLGAILQAKLVNGVDHFLGINGFDDLLDGADLVVTGEGAIDNQTLSGKGPYGVATRAKKRGIPVIGMAGTLPSAYDESLGNVFDILIPIGSRPESLEDAMANTFNNLERTARLAGDTLAVGHSIPGSESV